MWCLLQRSEKALTACFFTAAGRSGCQFAHCQWHWAVFLRAAMLHAGCCQCCCCALAASCCLGGVGGADIGLAPLYSSALVLHTVFITDLNTASHCLSLPDVSFLNSSSGFSCTWPCTLGCVTQLVNHPRPIPSNIDPLLLYLLC